MINIDVKMVFQEKCKESASLCRDMLENLPTGCKRRFGQHQMGIAVLLGKAQIILETF
jgi:hypothetical protein